MPENSEALEEQIDILEDIQRWVKIIGIQEAKEVLEEFMTSQDEEKQREIRIIYHLTDGEHSTRDIAQYISSSRSTVLRRQNKWAKAGFVERDNSNQPYRHVISLDEAGLEVPDIPEPRPEAVEANEAEE